MKCSSCSRHLRPVVVTDIDGTLSEYHHAVQMFAMNYFNYDYDEEYPEYDGSVPFREHLCLTQEQHRQMKLAYRQGGNKRWAVTYPNVVQGLNTLRNQGAEIWAATTRPWNRLDNIDPDTKFWLKENGIHTDGLLYGDDKYSQLLECVERDRIVICLEDLSSQIDVGTKLGLPMFHVYRPHNTSCRWKGGTFMEGVDLGLRSIQEWEHSHADV